MSRKHIKHAYLVVKQVKILLLACKSIFNSINIDITIVLIVIMILIRNFKNYIVIENDDYDNDENNVKKLKFSV